MPTGTARAWAREVQDHGAPIQEQATAADIPTIAEIRNGIITACMLLRAAPALAEEHKGVGQTPPAPIWHSP
jgi:hypothetical protein